MARQNNSGLIMPSVLTFDPLCVHLYDLVDELDREATFPLRLADLRGIAALAVNKVQNVQSHGVWVCVRREGDGGRKRDEYFCESIDCLWAPNKLVLLSSRPRPSPPDRHHGLTRVLRIACW